jgi:rRNA maturation RNase YbeY
MLNIGFYYDNVKYRIRGVKEITRLLEKVIRKEKRLSGDLNFIITTDKSVNKINREFLNHDYFTDVISFNYESGTILNGEIYISLETVRKNAYNYKVSLRNELIRVIIHGTLHICGYEDKTKREKLRMKKREEFWMNKLKKK